MTARRILISGASKGIGLATAAFITGQTLRVDGGVSVGASSI